MVIFPAIIFTQLNKMDDDSENEEIEVTAAEVIEKLEEVKGVYGERFRKMSAAVL